MTQKAETIVTSYAGLEVPGRTAFYPLIPKAIGSNQVESVFSYLSRLATAHHISIARLLGYLGKVCKSPGVEGWLAYPGRTRIKGVPR
jgi:hypothetical protein